MTGNAGFFCSRVVFPGGVSGAETSGQPASISIAVVLWFICRHTFHTFAPHA
jgi:hypothetical protein